MNKTKKTFLTIIILILLGINISQIAIELIKHTLSESITFSILLNIPLLIIVVYFFLKNDKSIKLSIKYSYLVVGILSMVMLIATYICYYCLSLPYVVPNLFLSLFFYLILIIFIISAFVKNFKAQTPDIGDIIYLSVCILPFFIIESVFLVIATFSSSAYDVTNPNRYETIRNYYSRYCSSFPREIPADATNVVFYYSKNPFLDPTISIKLKFDSETVTDNKHHAYYVLIDLNSRQSNRGSALS